MHQWLCVTTQCTGRVRLFCCLLLLGLTLAGRALTVTIRNSYPGHDIERWPYTVDVLINIEDYQPWPADLEQEPIVRLLLASDTTQQAAPYQTIDLTPSPYGPWPLHNPFTLIFGPSIPNSSYIARVAFQYHGEWVRFDSGPTGSGSYRKWYQGDGGSSTAGDPVLLGTGDEVHSPAGPDIQTYSPDGFHVSFSRTYRSELAKFDDSRYSPGLSPGWTHNFDFALIKEAPYTAQMDPFSLQTPQCGGDELVPTATGGSPPGHFTVGVGAPYDVIGIPENDTWSSVTMRFKTGEQWTFTPHGGVGSTLCVLSKITDALGRYVTLTWDTGRHLTAIRDSANNTLLSFTYDGNGCLSSVTDVPGGRKIVYTFTQPTGLPVCLTSVSQLGATGDTPPVRWTYAYDGFAYYRYAPGIGGVGMRVPAIAPLLTAVSQPSFAGGGQATITFEYDPAKGRVISYTDSNGNRQAYTYDDAQRATTVEVTDPQDNLVRTWTDHFTGPYCYAGRTDAAGHRSYVVYEDSRFPYQATRVTTPDGQSVSRTFDAQGNLASFTDVDGRVTTCTYDYSDFAFGRLVRVQRESDTPYTLTYLEPQGLVKTVTGPQPGSTSGTVTLTATYDLENDPTQQYGRIVQLQTPGNNAETTHTATASYNYTYDGQYDEDGDPGTYTCASPMGQPLTVTDEDGRTTHFRYDARGNVVLVIDDKGRRIDVDYNLADQVTGMQLPPETPSGPRRSAAYSHLFPGGPASTAQFYDEQLNALSTVAVTMDNEARPLSVQRNGTTQVAYTYDAMGNLRTLTDARNNTTLYNYDLAGRLTEVAYPGGRTWQAVDFDAAGRVLETLEGQGISFVQGTGYQVDDGVHTYYTYNTFGELATIDDETTAGVDATLSYNTNGDLAGVQDATGSRAWTYDQLGNVLTAATQYTGVGTQTLTYQYYPDGSLQRLATSFGHFDYRYNPHGQLVSLTNPAGHTSRWGYDAEQRLAKQTLGNHAWTSYAYDAMDRVTRMTNRAPKGRMLSEYGEFARDATDALTDSQTVTPGLPAHTGGSAYTFNEDFRLTGEQWTPAQGTGASAASTFDAAGNILTFPHELSGYEGLTRAYDDANQWIGYLNGQGQLTGGANFEYDGLGNPTTWKGDTLTFDQNNGLTSYTSGETEQMTAGYRADGLRAWKESNGARAYYLYDGATLLAEISADGTVKTYNTWGPTGLLNRTNLQTHREIWYLFDALGNVAQRTDATGNVVSADQYDAWGNLISGDDEQDPYGYNGRFGYYTDHETNLILCTLRYYDPEAGRWLNQDPIGYAGGLNVYAYCNNDPIDKIDPLGLSPYWDSSPSKYLSGFPQWYHNHIGKSWHNFFTIKHKPAWEEEYEANRASIERGIGSCEFRSNIAQDRAMWGVDQAPRGCEGLPDRSIPIAAAATFLSKNGEPLYRNGEWNVRPGIDVKIDKVTGKIVPGKNRGLSVNVNPDKAAGRGTPRQLVNVSEEGYNQLECNQQGQDEGHYVIGPIMPTMSPEELEEFMNENIETNPLMP